MVTRLRNKIISELVEELETSSAYKDRLTNPNSQGNSGTSIESFKILRQHFQGEVDVSDKERETNQTISADKILRNYLWCTDGCLESLINFPLISDLFIKYNIGMLSSAAAERLFIKAKNILKMNRCSLSDVNFEMQLLLEVNKYN